MASEDSESIPYTPLRSPSAYFQRHDRPSLGVAAGVMLAEALALGAILWLFVREVIANVDTSGVDTSSLQSQLLGQVFLFVVLTFVGWLIIAVVLHIFVWFSGDNRGFANTLAIVGETEFVALVTIPLTGIVMVNLAGQVPTDPQAAISFIRQAANSTTPLLLLIGFFGTIWRAILSGVGLTVVHGIPKSRAFAATFVVGFLGFLLGLAA